MGVGIIGVSSGAAEALPFGAGALITSGFVNGTTFNYTATVSPGRYIIEGSTADGDSPIIAYAPNSNTTAIAYPGKSAILNVTQTESVIRISAVPLLGLALPTGHGTTQGGRSFYRLTSYAQNPTGTNIVQGLVYFDGATWRAEFWTSLDSGATWTNTYTRSGDSNAMRQLEYIPEDGGYFLAGIGDANIFRSVNGFSWQAQSVTSGSLSTIQDYLNLGGGVVLCAHSNGIHRSTNHGVTWASVYSNSSAETLTRVENGGRIIGVYNAGMMWSTDGQNWGSSGFSYQNLQGNSFNMFLGLTSLKNYAVVGARFASQSENQNAGFSLLDPVNGQVITTAIQSSSGETIYRTQTAENSGSEFNFIVKTYENRGFIMAIGALTGTLSISTDGISWVKVGTVAGFSHRISAVPNNHGYAKFQSGLLTIPTLATGSAARYTNRFAYKIFASTI